MAKATESYGNFEEIRQLFRQNFLNYNDFDLFDETEMSAGGLACVMCCCLNIPNCMCTCGCVICYHCYKLNKATEKVCNKCKSPLEEEKEDQATLEKIEEIQDLKCPRRNCKVTGPFAQILPHFNSCCKSQLSSGSLYSLSTLTESGVTDFYLVKKQSESEKSSSCLKKIRCFSAQKQKEKEKEKFTFCWDIADLTEDPLPPSIYKNISVPSYPYKAIAKFEDNEFSLCIPANENDTEDRPRVIWPPVYSRVKYQFFIAEVTEGKVDATVYCQRQAEELYGVQIQNDGQYHFKAKIDTFIKRLKLERSFDERRNPGKQMLPCTVKLSFEGIDESGAKRAYKVGREYMYISDIASEVILQESKAGDELYSEYWYGEPLKLRCLASLDMRDPKNHLLVFRVLTSKHDKELTRQFGMRLHVRFYEVRVINKDINLADNFEVVQELFERKLYLRGFHTAFSLTKQPFWPLIYTKPIQLRIEFDFRVDYLD